MKPRPRDPEFWNPAALQRDLERAAVLCRGCRLCADLCPVFPRLLQAGDSETNLAPLRPGSLADLCYQCGLCEARCPYVPPHAEELEFSRLLRRQLLLRGRAQGVPVRDRFLSNKDLTGAIGSLTSAFTNRAARNPLFRGLLESLLGVDRRRLLPTFAGVTFEKWFQKRARRFRKQIAGTGGKVALFHGCRVNFLRPEVGRSAVAVLHHHDVEVVVPPQRCCGRPQLECGHLEGALVNLKENVRSFAYFTARGYTAVTLEPSCARTLAQDYPWLAPQDGTGELAEKVLDLGEYLRLLLRQGKLRSDFLAAPGAIEAHRSCHAEPAGDEPAWEEILRQIPGADIRRVDGCCAMGSLLGWRVRAFEEAQKAAAPLLRGLAGRPASRVVSDCLPAGLQILQETGRTATHPVEILREAYGLPATGEAKR